MVLKKISRQTCSAVCDWFEKNGAPSQATQEKQPARNGQRTITAVNAGSGAILPAQAVILLDFDPPEISYDDAKRKLLNGSLKISAINQSEANRNQRYRSWTLTAANTAAAKKNRLFKIDAGDLLFAEVESTSDVYEMYTTAKNWVTGSLKMIASSDTAENKAYGRYACVAFSSESTDGKKRIALLKKINAPFYVEDRMSYVLATDSWAEDVSGNYVWNIDGIFISDVPPTSIPGSLANYVKITIDGKDKYLYLHSSVGGYTSSSQLVTKRVVTKINQGE